MEPKDTYKYSQITHVIQTMKTKSKQWLHILTLLNKMRELKASQILGRIIKKEPKVTKPCKMVLKITIMEWFSLWIQLFLLRWHMLMYTAEECKVPSSSK